jgi:hypothetical protein
VRPLLLVSIFLFSFVAHKAQKYGNEWIRFSQQYHKIPIAKAGVYRLDSLTLSKYYTLGSVNPINFQVFIKGQEQFLYIKGEGDGVFNGTDYLEFYAEPFMGDIDSCLYTDIKYTPNPFRPIYNDTLFAFLTLNTSSTTKRYSLETDTNSLLYPPADHFYAEKIFTQYVRYNDVAEYSSFGVSDPHLTQAEGKGYPINKGTSFAFPVSNLNTYTTTAKNFYIHLNFSGASIDRSYSPDHQIQTYYKDQNNNQVLLADTSFNGYVPVRQSFTLNAQNTNNTSNITLTSVNAPSFQNPNSTNWHYAYYFYPHTLDLNNQSLFKLWIDNSSGSTKNFFLFSNFNSGASSSVLLYDLTNGRRISTVMNGSQVQAVIPNAAGRKLCVLVAEKDTIAVKNLIKVNGSGTFRNYGNPSVSKPFVIISHRVLQSSATDYKTYRQSIEGGSFNVIDADIDFLYEQFSYGARNHPLAIRNFLKFLKDTLSEAPRYVFLIGKSVAFNYASPSSFPAQNLIPSLGIPASDNLLTSNLSNAPGFFYYPEIPIGRLAALNNTEVIDYLNKVKEKESATKADWQKRVLHFVGGDDESLANILSSYMSNYGEIIKDTLFGAEVLTFKKNTTAPIQINISDSIRSVINNGAALINIFGHGSTNGFDQAIDDPNLYQNAGKYPFFIANSCYSGQIHQNNTRSVSERFVIAKQKGSIGFLATTSYGFDYALNNFTHNFYKALSQTHYNAGVGDMVKESAFKNSGSGDILIKITGLDMTLCGDPSVTLSNNKLPDYQILTNNVSFDLKKYTDSVGIVLNYKNTDKAIRDSILVKIDRYFPNGDTSVLLKKIKAPLFKDSLKVYLPIDFSRGIGLNKFRVELDYRNLIDETSESNNATSFIDLFIPGGDIAPVYPYKYAVVPKTPTLTLKASTTDPFAPTTTYRFELDTSDTFKSLLSTTLITSTGGVIEWLVNLPFKDSTVYFWRVSRDSISPEKTFAWRESSFQTLGDKRGWGQAQFQQFKQDKYQFVNYKKDLRKFVFENNVHSVKCRTGIHPYLNLSAFNYFFDTQMKEFWSSTFNGWNFAVFDSVSGQPQMTKSINFPNTGPGSFNNCVEDGYRYVYSFGAISACGGAAAANWRVDMENFLNAIPANHYVLAYTTGLNGNFSFLSSYSNGLFTAFESIGAKNIRTTADTVPYILFGKKGMSAGQAHVTIGTSKRSILNQEDTIRSKWKNGFIESEIIGPSNAWQSLHWRMQRLETASGDTSILKVIGIRRNGQQDTLRAFIQDSTDVLDLYNYVDAKIYPYVKLVAFMYDNVHRTSPQLKRWQVLYDEAPECAINPLKGFASINDTLQEGDQVTFRFPIENIGVKEFKDSLMVTYWIENNDRVKIDLPHSLKVPPFKAGDLIVDTIKLNTYQFKGNNVLWINVNPLQNARYQNEQELFNNIGRYPFNVYRDVTNPLLDVTFDGVRILNGDLVSSKPNILVTLKDENKFLALNDTGAFTIRLTKPDQSQERIYFGQQLEFTPAKLPKNSCSINYRPAFALDGKYALTVQASDRTNNASAARAYHIEFEVMTKPSITQVLNYPNPFTTSTRFVFTLTGNEIPEVFTIQIMTITGKIVKEITRGELGNIHIGRNITEYAWDGRDNYGDRLANGVYLYRVITKLNGENIERKTSGADTYFTKEFGKMVLMR